MTPLRTRGCKPAAPTHALRRRLEALEDRTVPTTVSVAGATLNEIGSPAAFVAPGSGGLDVPLDITLGPDGNLYVACNGGAVRRYNGTTGEYISTFVTQGSGGLSGVFGLAFGPDGNLYVANPGFGDILRYDGTTGAFMDIFVDRFTANGLGIVQDVIFGPDGNLYVTSARGGNCVRRFEGPLSASPGAPLPAPGQTLAYFVIDSGGLFSTTHLLFGPDGNADGLSDLYVACNNGVRCYDGTTGAYLNTLAANGQGDLAPARSLAVDPDGRIYVSDTGNAIHRYDAQGNSLGDLLINSASFALNKPLGLAFDAQGALLISCRDADAILRYERGVVVSLSAPSAVPVTVNYATQNGTASSVADYFAQSGRVTFQPGETARRVLLATRDDLDAESVETFSVQLSNPTGGATIGTGTATVSVVDEDAGRQASVTDALAAEGDHAVHYRGAFIETFPGNGGFYPVTFAGGFVYAGRQAGPGANAIDRYDAATGAYLGTFVPPDGRIQGLRGITVRDGYLYVTSVERHAKVLRYSATTGAFVDEFVGAFPSYGGFLYSPNGLAFGPDINGDQVPELYVTGSESNTVPRYDGVTGDAMLTYVMEGSGGLASPRNLEFGPDGFLYVTSFGSNQVLKYNAWTCAFVGVAAAGSGLSNPQDIEFGPDGLMYVTSSGNNRIMRFTLAGAYVDDYVPAGSNGMVRPTKLQFGPDGDLYVASDPSQVMRFGTANEALFTVSISTPSTLPVTVSYTTANGSAVAGSDYTAVTGTVTFEPGVTSKIIRVPLLDDTLAEPTETFAVNLSNPVGATIGDGQGAGTITDNDLARVGSVAVNGGVGAQRSRVTSVTVTFTAAVTFAGPVADAFTVSRIGGGALGGFTATAAVVNGVTVVTLSNFTGAETQFGSLADGRYALTVRAIQVSANGQPLDGNGDGTGGDDYALDGTAANGLFRLYGDATGDGTVNAADLAPFRGAFGSATGQAAYVEWLDLDGDGFINAFDFAQFRTRFGLSLP